MLDQPMLKINARWGLELGFEVNHIGEGMYGLQLSLLFFVLSLDVFTPSYLGAPHRWIDDETEQGWAYGLTFTQHHVEVWFHRLLWMRSYRFEINRAVDPTHHDSYAVEFFFGPALGWSWLRNGFPHATTGRFERSVDMVDLGLLIGILRLSYFRSLPNVEGESVVEEMDTPDCPYHHVSTTYTCMFDPLHPTPLRMETVQHVAMETDDGVDLQVKVHHWLCWKWAGVYTPTSFDLTDWALGVTASNHNIHPSTPIRRACLIKGESLNACQLEIHLLWMSLVFYITLLEDEGCDLKCPKTARAVLQFPSSTEYGKILIQSWGMEHENEKLNRFIDDRLTWIKNGYHSFKNALSPYVVW